MDKKVILYGISVAMAIVFGVLSWAISEVMDDVVHYVPSLKPQFEFLALTTLVGGIIIPSLAGVDGLKELQRYSRDNESLKEKLEDLKKKTGFYD